MERVHEDSRLRPLEASIHRTLPDAEITETALHLCPELKLHLMSWDKMQQRFSAEETRAILAADVLYDRENHPFLQEFLERAPEILVADSRIRTMEVRPYRKITEITASTVPDLDESDEFKRVSIYHAFTGRPGEMSERSKQGAFSCDEKSLAQSSESM